MFDNTKEYIVCAAYRIKDGSTTPNIASHNEKLKSEPDHGLTDIRDLYKGQCRDVFYTVQGWRHPDILYKFGDIIDRKDTGGFMTSRGRYVDRKEAMEIALACGQVEESKTIHGKGGMLFSEDIY